MALFDSSIIDEILRQGTQRGATSQTGDITGTTNTRIDPGEMSRYAGELERIAGGAGTTGGAYADILSRFRDTAINSAPALWGQYPSYDAAGARKRADAYATLLEGAGTPLLERGRADLLETPNKDVLSRLHDTALNPTDDDLENYFEGRFNRDTDSELARLGLVGQGRGQDLKFDARQRYTMGRREAADARRINASDAMTRLSGADLDQALKEMTAGAGFATGAYGARDAAEKDIYNFDLTTQNYRNTAPTDVLMRLAGVGGAEGQLRTLPANLYGTLYAIDQSRLNRGVNQTTTSSGRTSATGATSLDTLANGTGSTIKSPSALDDIAGSVKLLSAVPDALKGAGALASAGSSALSAFGF